MRTLIILVIGFVSLGATLGVLHLVGAQIPARRTALIGVFIAWGLLCALNIAQGIRLGHRPLTELAVFALTFGLPLLAAMLLRKHP